MISIGILLILLSGCSDGIENTGESVTTPNPPPPAIPTVSQLQIELRPDNFHTLDFMALHDCSLQITLGKYQSSLGRHASDSQRLLLDLEFLSLAPQCIKLNGAAKNSALTDTLKNIQAIKHRQLPARIYNATLANTEFQQVWQGTPPRRTTPYQAKLALPAIAEINASVRRWLTGDYRASNLEFEIQLGEMASADITGSLGKGIHQASTELEALLLSSLPLQYQRWQKRRGEYFARLAPPTKLD